MTGSGTSGVENSQINQIVAADLSVFFSYIESYRMHDAVDSDG